MCCVFVAAWVFSSYGKRGLLFSVGVQASLFAEQRSGALHFSYVTHGLSIAAPGLWSRGSGGCGA